MATKDPWLYRDSASLLMLSRYAKDGLELPDRFDMDPENLGTRDIKLHRVENLRARA